VTARRGKLYSTCLRAITDAGLVHLAGLTNLTGLRLEDTKVSDRGLKHLERLTNLESINLDGTEVTDAGLVHLKKLPKLSSVRLPRGVTDAGVKELQRAFPKASIDRSRSSD
jgi:internalin A